jgi:hypothetical protein
MLTVATAPVYFFGIINFKMNGHRTSWKIEKSKWISYLTTMNLAYRK